MSRHVLLGIAYFATVAAIALATAKYGLNGFVFTSFAAWFAWKEF